MKKRLAILLIIIMIAGAISGCGKDQKEPAGETAKGTMKIGMIIKDPTAPFEVAFAQGAKDKAAELGIDIDIKDGQADSLKIMELMDNYITQRVDGFIMAGAVDLKAIVPGVKKLNEANIPIMATTISSSIRVKPASLFMVLSPFLRSIHRWHDYLITDHQSIGISLTAVSFSKLKS